MMYKQNWFNTLNSSLNSENLVELWEFGVNVGYGQTVRLITNCGHLISVYRDDTGRYERPVHYQTKICGGVQISRI
ncbi:hypothetical protein UFOVP1655_152 [uncultured Caudovirales phage]|uniref:Uncharacterized protein n=1 Tax=uncultured Caudovirales phage TaxID=2100421 RepID=A0A6J5T6V7_9CAUD|nr:hypothetical protein UFOVP1655_152 [uncultured Caudovirales phage]